MSRLERWSRLKRGVAQERVQEKGQERGQERVAQETPAEAPGSAAPAPEAQAVEALEREAEARPSPEPGSLDHTLPDPDTLPPGSDIKAYLASGVSSGLRKRALRRLFAADHYGIRDGLDDYDDDYRATLKPLASEAAERLRHWTRRAVASDEEAPREAAQETRGAKAREAPGRPAAEAEADAAPGVAPREEPDARPHDAPPPPGRA